MASIDHNHQSGGLIEETRDFANHAQRYAHTLRHENGFGRFYRDNPYAVLAAAAGLGYVLAGGLLTPFTRRLLSIGLKGAVVPLAAKQIKGFVDLPES